MKGFKFLNLSNILAMIGIIATIFTGWATFVSVRWSVVFNIGRFTIAGLLTLWLLWRLVKILIEDRKQRQEEKKQRQMELLDSIINDKISKSEDKTYPLFLTLAALIERVQKLEKQVSELEKADE